MMTSESLSRRLDTEGIVTLDRSEWESVREAYPEVERHATHLAGDLIIVRDPHGPVAVEEPTPRTRVLRRLTDEDAVRRFVQDRLATYERMWDGCGCKVEYYR